MVLTFPTGMNHYQSNDKLNNEPQYVSGSAAKWRI